MLYKSKRNAMIMSVIPILSYAATELLISLAVKGFIDGRFPPLQGVSPFGVHDLPLVAVFFFIFVIGVVMGGFFINTLSADHFGVSGAIRWAILGATYAVLEHLYQAIAGSIPLILQGLGELAILVAAYLIAFEVVPANRTKRKASS